MASPAGVIDKPPMFKTECNVNQKSLVGKLTSEVSAQAEVNNVLITRSVESVCVCVDCRVHSVFYIESILLPSA